MARLGFADGNVVAGIMVVCFGLVVLALAW